MTPESRFRAAASLHQAGQLDGAAALYAQIARHDPAYADALHMLGLIALQQGRHGDGIRLIEQSLQRNPRQPMALANLARALAAAGQLPKAIDYLDASLRLAPGFTDGLLFRANLLMQTGRPADALADYDRLIGIQPDFAGAHCNRCSALLELKRPREALDSADRALVLDPQLAEAHNNRGNALRMLGYSRDAIPSFERALAIRPDYPDALSNLCGALYQLRHHAKTLQLYERLLQLAPDYPYALGNRFHVGLHCCEWTDYAARITALEQAVLAGHRAAHPGVLLSVSASPLVQLRGAQTYIAHKFAAAKQLVSSVAARGRIRIAYVSSDFGEHPVTHLVAGVLASHDRDAFEVHGVSTGRENPGSEMQQQLRRSFAAFHEAAGLNDTETSKLIGSLHIDIAIDLNGHTLGARPGVFARRVAPVQVCFLGYAGTTGAHWMDYLLADAVVIPPGEPGYSERIVRLPGSFMPRDDRVLPAAVPTRAAENLPKEAFVFCAFNPSYKLTPVMFDVWMRLLQRLPGSVLWLRDPGDVAKVNLQHEAQARGVDAERLIFARRVDSHGEHLARHQLADLFLDTLPYNAHTTASDALYVGLPVLTCQGTTFVGRVAESLLRALELPELVARDLSHYEELAVLLAQEPARLKALRERLEVNRRALPVFNTQRYTRQLEAAYRLMLKRLDASETPADIDVPVV
jgi:protein O-GlcNAc transferase